MVVSKYPASNGGLRVAKGVFCLLAIVLGSAFGRNFLRTSKTLSLQHEATTRATK